MWSTGEWCRAADRVADDVLRHGGYGHGAVDGLRLAHRLGFDVIYDRQQSTRGRLKQFGIRRSIFIKPDQRPERIHWAVCHELGESFAVQVFRSLGARPDDCGPGTREQVANLLASRLLLPTATFFPEAERLEESLPDLKAIFNTASHELIANRLLDQESSRCITIVDQGRITKRRANRASCTKEFLPLERECWEESHEQGSHSERIVEDLRARCWAIHEPHWKREILLMNPLHEVLV